MISDNNIIIRKDKPGIDFRPLAADQQAILLSLTNYSLISGVGLKFIRRNNKGEEKADFIIVQYGCTKIRIAPFPEFRFFVEPWPDPYGIRDKKKDVELNFRIITGNNLELFFFHLRMQIGKILCRLEIKEGGFIVGNDLSSHLLGRVTPDGYEISFCIVDKHIQAFKETYKRDVGDPVYRQIVLLHKHIHSVSYTPQEIIYRKRKMLEVKDNAFRDLIELHFKPLILEEIQTMKEPTRGIQTGR